MQSGKTPKMSSLNAAHLKNEEAAYAFVEARVWPEGGFAPIVALWATVARSRARAPVRASTMLFVPQAVHGEGGDDL